MAIEAYYPYTKTLLALGCLELAHDAMVDAYDAGVVRWDERLDDLLEDLERCMSSAERRLAFEAGFVMGPGLGPWAIR